MARLSHDEFLTLATRRSEARLRKDFKLADDLKKQIEKGGYSIEDAKDGSGGYSFSAIPEVSEVGSRAEVVTKLTPAKRPQKK